MQQDGSARGDPGATDCGGLFQNKFAAYLACFTANLGVRNSLYEEIMGAILAIELVEHKGWRYLWPECDSSFTDNQRNSMLQRDYVIMKTQLVPVVPNSPDHKGCYRQEGYPSFERTRKIYNRIRFHGGRRSIREVSHCQREMAKEQFKNKCFVVS